MDLVKESFLQAAGFTVLMVALGILIGLQMDDLRQDQLSNELRQSQLDSETFTVLESYTARSDNNHCELLEVQIPEMGDRSAQLGARLERFEAQNLGDDKDYQFIRNQYYNNQLRLYMALQDHRNECETNQDSILYFFDESTDSERQGAVLNEIVEERDVQVFSFNAEIEDSPIVNVLKADYNITEQPTIVINGEEKYEGFVSEGELQNDILN